MDLTVSLFRSFHLAAFRFIRLANDHSFSHLLIVTCILGVPKSVYGIDSPKAHFKGLLTLTGTHLW